MKRALALVTVIILISLYIAAAVLAILGDPRAAKFSIACVLVTIMLPIIIHIFLVLTNVRKGNGILDEPYSYKKKTNDNSL